MRNKTVRTLIFILAFAVAGYVIIQYGLFGASNSGFVTAKLQEKPNFHLKPWVYVLYAHIITAVLPLVIGPFQIFVKQSKARIRQHRLLGYVYVISIFISGILGLYLSLYASGGWIAGLGFFGLDIMWMSTTFIALRKILAKDIKAHREWMLRSYALTFAAVTLRVWIFPLSLLFGGDAGSQIVAWFCWIPNLLVIEAVIRMKKY